MNSSCPTESGITSLADFVSLAFNHLGEDTNTSVIYAMLQKADNPEQVSRVQYLANENRDIRFQTTQDNVMYGVAGAIATDGLFRITDSLLTKPPTQKFSVKPSKFDYFFGKVTSGTEHNILRSADNLRDLSTLGIHSEAQLVNVFEQAAQNGVITSPIWDNCNEECACWNNRKS